MSDENHVSFNKFAIRISVCLAVIFLAAFAVGTFFDHQVAEAVFSRGNVAALVVSTLGIYVFCGAFSFYFGAALSQALKVEPRPKRILYSTIVAILGICVMIGSGGSLLDINNLGGIFPEVHRDVPQMAITFFVVFLPVAVVGFVFGKKSTDPRLGRRIVLILNCMVIMFLAYELIKTGMPRPRFRLVSQNIEGIGFHAWFDPIQNKNDLISAFNLNGDDFKSFPSGHTANGIMSIAVLPGLAAVIPALKKRMTLLFFVGLVFGFAVLASRMVLGAHFLSDVSVGGFIASVASAVYYKREETLFR